MNKEPTTTTLETALLCSAKSPYAQTIMFLTIMFLSLEILECDPAKDQRQVLNAAIPGRKLPLPDRFHSEEE
jgi:hypothetical protein